MKAGVKTCKKKEWQTLMIIFSTERICHVIPETQSGDISDIYGMMECNFDTSLLGGFQILEKFDRSSTRQDERWEINGNHG